MALIINVEIPAGQTIEEAIHECVEFAYDHKVMVRTNINDVPMLICYDKMFGADTNCVGDNINHCTDTFVKAYHEYKRGEHG